MMQILDGVTIPEDELVFTASRSGGPGGQNVNKVSTKITLAFDVEKSRALSEEQKRKIAGKLATRINNDGQLLVVSQRTRSQELNRADAMDRFCDLLRKALQPRKARIKTRLPKSAKEQRLNEKKKRSARKLTRSSKGWDG